MVRFIIGIIICSLTTTSALAQTDTSSFLIRVFGDSDTQSPTASVLSGVATAQTQTELSWSVATDNFMVSGYVIFRNGSAIATTSQTTYTDTGLSASTTYSYFVRAFDPSFNYSLPSNNLSLTTLTNPPPTATETSSAGGTATRVVLNSIDITPKERAATFLVTTVRPARFEIRWGRTGSYELGYTVTDVYASSYQTTLTDLEPGTLYQYEVVGYTPFGAATVLERGQFSTVGPADFLPPTNVQGFSAVRDGSSVRLSWNIPGGDDGSLVRIVRSHLGFPAHIQDGVLVYQGAAESVEDKNVLLQYSPVYYTAFVVDAAGNVSSGAVARVYAVGEGVSGGEVLDPPIPGGLDGVQEDTVASTSLNVPFGTKMPLLEEIFLQQNDIRVSLSVQRIILTTEDSLLLSIPKSAISDNLKTIIASLTDPTDSRRTYSFMLRINKDQTAYEAMLPPVMLSGKSRLIIDIYEYNSLLVANYQKTIEFKSSESITPVPVFPDTIISVLSTYGWVAATGVITFLLLILFYRQRRKPGEDNG